jgi:lipoic acid synthetase
MILGNICTRNCAFCAVESGQSAPLIPAIDPAEPEQVAKTAAELKLKHVVITSVTRDDLPDQGAVQFARTIRAVRQLLPQASIEVLTPDFQGETALLDVVLQAGPDVFNHNMETVPRLYPSIRPQALYQRSLAVLKYAAGTSTSSVTKSGLMVGLGETEDEIISVLHDLKNNGVQIVTIGQYLAPSRKHAPVKEYVSPEQFNKYREIGEKLGLKQVFSAPLVRSSYRAEEVFTKS